jgi:alpha-amylase/alpha-mannosidase (GH57 family)
MTAIHHALVLNLHQPPNNLEYLFAEHEWEAKEILFAYDRIARSLWGYEDVGRVHVALSGTLLESLSSPEFQEKTYGVVDSGSLLWHWQNRSIIDILGTGYYHPVFPLIPEADWDEHLGRWRSIARHLFWRENFKGFWPPEMGFCMEMIPHLAKLGYRYVIVDSDHVEPKSAMRWEELRYRPHIARHGGAEIIVVVRDRDLSDAQEAGMEFGWFEREVAARTQWCSFEPLVTTATDGENGGWFRNVTEGSNFWSCFYRELMNRARGDGAIKPTFIDAYLDKFGASGQVTVREGAWNTGWHHGKGFVQWTGSQAQKDALARVAEISVLVNAARGKAIETELHDPDAWHALTEAQWHLLRGETSCNFYWGEDWVHRAHEDLDAALVALRRIPA